jgi:hypothetical protein
LYSEVKGLYSEVKGMIISSKETEMKGMEQRLLYSWVNSFNRNETDKSKIRRDSNLNCRYRRECLLLVFTAAGNSFPGN